MSATDQPLPAELLPYPSHPALRALFKSPILLYRLGLGWRAGRLFMILTSTGRKSGLPRRTAVEYRRFLGQKYAMNAYGTESDWYRNISADPRVTIQTADGVEHCRARRLTSDAELAEAYGFVESSPAFRRLVQRLGFEITGRSSWPNGIAGGWSHLTPRTTRLRRRWRPTCAGSCRWRRPVSSVVWQ